MRFKVLRVCQSKGFSVVPQESVRFDLEKASEILRKEGHEVSPSDVMVTVEVATGLEVTLYANGRLMVQPLDSKDVAHEIAEKFYSSIEGARE
ncbi:MAG: hypothetical protein LUQ39_02785 [Methanomassiliicoccales archaeon]|jgi:hypothetical protein|nr:hypothetical protein [Methanomassiliicoccales archaeon]